MNLASMAAPAVENARLYSEIREAERKYRAIFENAINGLFQARPDGRYVTVNPAFARMFGYDSPTQMVASVADIGKQIYNDPARYAQLKSQLNEDGEVRGLENLVVRKDGTSFWVSENIRAVRDSRGALLFYEGVVEDITRRKQDEAKISYLSYHDKLTGLHNRAFFEKEAKRLNSREHLPVSLILGDVNGLKLVNDALGHGKGDELLCKMAKVLKSCCRRGDVLARWGGDEFAMLLPRTSYETALNLSRQIIQACRRHHWGSVPLSISLGLAVKTEVRQSFGQLLKEAEDRLYRRKLLEGRSIHSAIIASLRKTLWESSHETEEHAERLRQLAVGFGSHLGLSTSELDELSLLATLHDIGKIGIPDHILEKPGPLDADEWEIMKQHPEIGCRIVQSSAELAVVAKAVLAHHERWDGTGYPQGLSGTDIPLSSRILNIVDAYDVITHERPYKKAMEPQDALAEILRCAGTQFDPDLAKKFVEYVAQGQHQQKIYPARDCTLCPSRTLCTKTTGPTRSPGAAERDPSCSFEGSEGGEAVDGAKH